MNALKDNQAFLSAFQPVAPAEHNSLNTAQEYDPAAGDLDEWHDGDIVAPDAKKQLLQFARQLAEGGALPDGRTRSFMLGFETAIAAAGQTRGQAQKTVARGFSDLAKTSKSGAPTANDAPPLPFPTEKYVGNRGGGASGENIVDFLRRVWGQHIEAGLSRPELRQQDAAADEAITNWRRHSAWPDDLPVLTKSEMKARREARLSGDPRAVAELRAARSHVQRLERAMGKR